ncbi:Hypothetical protein FKW44_013480, partial [Caligus rogercresseyi]
QDKIKDLEILRSYMEPSGKEWVDKFLAAQRGEDLSDQEDDPTQEEQDLDDTVMDYEK